MVAIEDVVNDAAHVTEDARVYWLTNYMGALARQKDKTAARQEADAAVATIDRLIASERGG